MFPYHSEISWCLGIDSHHPWRSPLRGRAVRDQNRFLPFLSNEGFSSRPRPAPHKQKTPLMRGRCSLIIPRSVDASGLIRAIPGAHPFGVALVRAQNGFLPFLSNEGFSSWPRSPPHKQKTPLMRGFLFMWRRARDSNPRYAINVYTLSRRAPSATRTALQIFEAQGYTRSWACANDLGN